MSLSSKFGSLKSMTKSIPSSRKESIDEPPTYLDLTAINIVTSRLQKEFVAASDGEKPVEGYENLENTIDMIEKKIPFMDTFQASISKKIVETMKSNFTKQEFKVQSFLKSCHVDYFDPINNFDILAVKISKSYDRTYNVIKLEYESRLCGIKTLATQLESLYNQEKTDIEFENHTSSCDTKDEDKEILFQSLSQMKQVLFDEKKYQQILESKSNNKPQKILSEMDNFPLLKLHLPDQELCKFRNNSTSVIPYLNPYHSEKWRFVLNVHELGFSPAFEPLFGVAALYDLRSNQKVTESFFIDANNSDLVSNSVAALGITGKQRNCLFEISSVDISFLCLVIKLEKLVQKKELGDYLESYAKLKNDNLSLSKAKLKSASVGAQSSGIRSPVGWCHANISMLLKCGNSFSPSHISFSNEKPLESTIHNLDKINQLLVGKKKFAPKLSSVSAEISSFFMAESEMMNDSHLFNLIREVDGGISKVRTFPMDCKFSFSLAPNTVTGVFDDTPVTPLSKDTIPSNLRNQDVVYKMLELPQLNVVTPFTTPRNLMYLYPLQVDTSSKCSLGKNILIEFNLIGGDKMEKINCFYSQRINEKFFVSEYFTSVWIKKPQPTFYDEIKVCLPWSLDANAHFLVKFYQIEFHTTSVQQDRSLVAQTWIPLYHNFRILSGRIKIPVSLNTQLPAGYHLTFPDQCELSGIKWLNSKSPIFEVQAIPSCTTFSLDIHSRRFLSVPLSDPKFDISTPKTFLNGKLKLHLSEFDSEAVQKNPSLVPRLIMINSISFISIDILAPHLHVIFDKLLSLVPLVKNSPSSDPNDSELNEQSISIQAFISLVICSKRIIDEIKECTDQLGRNQLLGGYSYYVFDPRIVKCSEWIPVESLESSKRHPRKSLHESIVDIWTNLPDDILNHSLKPSTFLLELLLKCMIQETYGVSGKADKFNKSFLGKLHVLLVDLVKISCNYLQKESNLASNVIISIAHFLSKVSYIIPKERFYAIVKSIYKNLNPLDLSHSQSHLLTKVYFNHILLTEEPILFTELLNVYKLEKSKSIDLSLPIQKLNEYDSCKKYLIISSYIKSMIDAMESKNVDVARAIVLSTFELLSRFDQKDTNDSLNLATIIASLFVPYIPFMGKTVNFLSAFGTSFVASGINTLLSRESLSRNPFDSFRANSLRNPKESNTSNINELLRAPQKLSESVITLHIVCVIWILKHMRIETFKEFWKSQNVERRGLFFDTFSHASTLFNTQKEGKLSKNTKEDTKNNERKIHKILNSHVNITRLHEKSTKMMANRNWVFSIYELSEIGEIPLENSHQTRCFSLFLKLKCSTIIHDIILNTLNCEECYPMNSEIIPKGILLMINLIAMPQCKSLYESLLDSMHFCIRKYQTVFVDKLYMTCELLGPLLIDFCSSDDPHLRYRSISVMYQLVRINLEEYQNMPQIAHSLSFSISNKIENDRFGRNCQKNLCESLNSLLVFAKKVKDSNLEFYRAVHEFVDFLLTYQFYFLKMNHHDIWDQQEAQQSKTKLENIPNFHYNLDLMIAIADRCKNFPGLRITWLKRIGSCLEKAAFYAEAATCHIHCAAIISECLTLSNYKFSLPKSAYEYSSMSVNVLEESLGNCKLYFCMNDLIKYCHWISEKEAVQHIRSASIFFQKANLPKRASECCRILLEYYDSLNKIEKCAELIDWISQLLKRSANSATAKLKRDYFFIGFYGVKFNDLHLLEYIYCAPTALNVVILQNDLKNFVDSVYPHLKNQQITFLTSSTQVDLAKLDPNELTLQIVFVQPYQEIWEQHMKIGNVNNRFFFNSVTKVDGKSQYSRVVFTTSHSFPYIQSRIPVINRESYPISELEGYLSPTCGRIYDLESILKSDPIDYSTFICLADGFLFALISGGYKKLLEMLSSNHSKNPEEQLQPDCVNEIMLVLKHYYDLACRVVKVLSEYHSDDNGPELRSKRSSLLQQITQDLRKFDVIPQSDNQATENDSVRSS